MKIRSGLFVLVSLLLSGLSGFAALKVMHDGAFSSETSLFSLTSNGLPNELLHCGRSLIAGGSLYAVNETGKKIKIDLPAELRRTVTAGRVDIEENFKSQGREYALKASYELEGEAISVRCKVASPGLKIKYLALFINPSIYQQHTFLLDGRERAYPGEDSGGKAFDNVVAKTFAASQREGFDFKITFAGEGRLGMADARRWGQDAYALRIYADPAGEVQFTLLPPTGGQWEMPEGLGEGQNLLKNGSFETGLNGWGVVLSQSDGASSFGVDSAGIHGNKALRIDLRHGEGLTKFLRAKLASEFFKAPFQTEVTFSVDLKADENLNGDMAILYYPMETVGNRGSVRLSKKIKVGKSWERKSYTLRLPRGQQGAYAVALSLSGGKKPATVFVDGACVQLGRKSDYVAPADIEVAGTTPASDNLYEPGTEIPVLASIRNNTELTLSATLLCTILDPFYHVVSQTEKSVTVAPQSTMDRAFGDFHVTLQNRGAHRTYIKVLSAGGATLASHGFTIGVLEDKKLATVRPESRFGANMKLDSLDYASRIGFTWGRNCVQASWQDIEPVPGQYKESVLQAVEARIAAMNAVGMTPLLQVGRTSRWASSAPAGSTEYAKYPPAKKHMAAYGRFLEHLVARFKGRVFAYEVWNEPNIPMFYRGTPEEFVDVLQTAHAAIKKVDPDALVIALGLTSYNKGAKKFLNDVLSVTGTDCCDAVSWHPYRPGRDDPEATLMRDEFNEIYNDIGKYGGHKPLWITEVGWFAPHKWSVPFTPYKNSHIAKVLCTEELCARWYTQMAVTAFANHVENFQYFIFEEGNITDRWFHGFTGPNYRSLKAAYFSAAACVRNTDYSDVLGQELLFGKIYLTGFKRDGEETQVLWAASEAIDVEIATETSISCEDLYGNPFALTPKDGKVWLTVTGDVVYLKCARSSVKIEQAAFSLAPHTIQTEPGEAACVRVNGRLPMALKLDSGFLSRPLKEVEGQNIILKPRTDLIPNEKYQLLATMGRDGVVHGRLQWSVVAGNNVGSVDHPKTGKRGGEKPGSIVSPKH